VFKESQFFRKHKDRVSWQEIPPAGPALSRACGEPVQPAEGPALSLLAVSLSNPPKGFPTDNDAAPPQMTPHMRPLTRLRRQ
jgi:hypothetical protein